MKDPTKTFNSHVNLLSGRVNKAPVLQAVNCGSIPSRVKPSTKEILVFTAFLLCVQQKNRQYEAYIKRGEQLSILDGPPIPLASRLGEYRYSCNLKLERKENHSAS